MTIHYQFIKAEKIIRNMSPHERSKISIICNEIRYAENCLNLASEKMVQRCYFKCGGICCRNVDLDAIIGHWDLVYVLTMDPGLKKRILKCLEKEIPLFTSNCMFLENDIGPCIFPSDIRPEKCITTFCFDDSPVKSEIKSVKNKFMKLGHYIAFRKPQRLMHFLFRTLSKHTRSAR